MTTNWLAEPQNVSGFLQECKLAAERPEVFATFRQMPYICNIVESRPATWMGRFLDPLRRILPDEYDRLIEIAKRIDAVGGPTLAPEPHPPISPTTASYLMVYAGLRFLFGPLAGKRIVEIGGGYGGQAAVICMAEPVGSYAIRDLNEPTALQRRFIKSLSLNHALGADVSDNGPWDLCVSSCALSEIDEAGRTEYVTKILANCKSGWLAWNFPPHPIDGWIADPRDARDWLASKLPGVEFKLGRDSGLYRELIGNWADSQIYWGAK